MRTFTGLESNTSVFVLSWRRLFTTVFVQAFRNDSFVAGSMNEVDVSSRNGASDAMALPSKSGPDVDESTFIYATAFFFRSSSNCSPHSVDPVSPTSSPSHEQKIS